MTGGEALYLALVVGAFGVFSLTMALAGRKTHDQSEKSGVGMAKWLKRDR